MDARKEEDGYLVKSLETQTFASVWNSQPKFHLARLDSTRSTLSSQSSESSSSCRASRAVLFD